MNDLMYYLSLLYIVTSFAFAWSEVDAPRRSYKRTAERDENHSRRMVFRWSLLSGVGILIYLGVPSTLGIAKYLIIGTACFQTFAVAVMTAPDKWLRTLIEKRIQKERLRKKAN